MNTTPVGPQVENCQGGLVEWHGPFGGQLAQRHPQPGAGRPVVHDGVELEVEQFTGPQTAAAQHLQAGPGERVGQVGDGGHQPGVDVRSQSPG